MQPRPPTSAEELHSCLAKAQEVGWDNAYIQSQRSTCYHSFLHFIEKAWPVLEPATPFVRGWAIDAIAEHLVAVTNGQIKRLLINVPPGFSKSMFTNVFWPAWEWGPRGLSHHRFISAGYEKGLATRDLVRGRDLVGSEWYQARWPMELKEDQDQKTYYANLATGWRLASSVGGSLTGYRGDRIIIDDPHDVKRAESDLERATALRWFTETLPTRFNSKKAAMVVIMQRLHERDISGLILQDMLQDYTHLMLPMRYEPERKCKTTVVMSSTFSHEPLRGKPFEDPRTVDGELLFPERFDQEYVDRTERAMSAMGGDYAVAAQHQQRPAPRGGGMFPRDKVNFIDAPMVGGRRCRGWDLAGTKDGGAATAGVKIAIVPRQGSHAGFMVVIEDVRWLRGGADEVQNAIVDCAKQDGYNVEISLPQDPGQSGKFQKAHLIGNLQGYKAYGTPESGSKEDRAIPVEAQWKAGNVYLVRAPWNDRFLAEAEVFPAGQRKDQIDALSRAYGHLILYVEQLIDLACKPALVDYGSASVEE